MSVSDATVPPLIALGWFFLFLLMRVLLRRRWLAAVVAVGVVAVVDSGALSKFSIFELLLELTGLSVYFAISTRFGMLTLTVAIIAVSSVVRYPMRSSFSAWYAPLGLMEVGLLLAVAVWSFRNALGGRKVWKGEFLDR